MATALPERGSIPVALLRAQTVSLVSTTSSIVSARFFILPRASSIALSRFVAREDQSLLSYSCSRSLSPQISSATVRSPWEKPLSTIALKSFKLVEIAITFPSSNRAVRTPKSKPRQSLAQLFGRSSNRAVPERNSLSLAGAFRKQRSRVEPSVGKIASPLASIVSRTSKVVQAPTVVVRRFYQKPAQDAFGP
jgi:hypothetical protein